MLIHKDISNYIYKVEKKHTIIIIIIIMAA